MTEKKQSGGVTIGNVSGGIHRSIIAGRDVKNATITMGGQPIPVDKEPTSDELKQLLIEIQKELAAIASQKETLGQISPAAPYTAQGAEQSVQTALAAVDQSPEMEPTEAQSVQTSLTEATTLLTGILDGARAVAEKAVAVGKAVKPIAEHLEPLIEKLGVAAVWVAKL